MRHGSKVPLRTKKLLIQIKTTKSLEVTNLRSPIHPSDPSNPKNSENWEGGGVLIVVKKDIEAEVQRISMRKGAEIDSVEVEIRNEKLMFCSVYRVGTLGSVNHHSIMSSLKSFYGGRN